MKKHNLLKITFSAAVLITAVLFTGCQRDVKSPHKSSDEIPSNPAVEKPTDDPITDDPITDDPVTELTVIPVPKISINTSNAQALAGTMASGARFARAADSEETTNSNTLLQKILEGNTIHEVVNCPVNEEVASVGNSGEPQRVGFGVVVCAPLRTHISLEG